jgi:hypothetical protein
MKDRCLYVSKQRTRLRSLVHNSSDERQRFRWAVRAAECQLTRAINPAKDTGICGVSTSATETAGGNGPDNEWIAQHWSVDVERVVLY